MKELQQVKFNNELILTTEQLAEFYGTTPKRITDNFNANKDKFVEGTHYFHIDGSKLKFFKDLTRKTGLVNEHASSINLWTKRGASRHSKMLGTDQAWDMYDRLEESCFSQEQKALNVSKLSPELQMFNNLFKAIANNELANKRLESKIDKISEIVALNNANWRKNSRLLIIKMTRVPGVSREFKEIQADIYKELNRRAAADVKRRLINMKNRMAGQGVPKQRRDKMNELDVIAEDKRLKEIYLAIVKEYAIKFGVDE